MLYGCEAWTLKKADEKRLEAAEMWFYRRLLKVSWTEKRTNESILNELSIPRHLLAEINKRRLKYVGHVNRNEKATLMTTVLQGKVESKRKIGRPPISYIENIKKCSKLSLHEIVKKSQDRNVWRRIAATCYEAANLEDDEAL